MKNFEKIYDYWQNTSINKRILLLLFFAFIFRLSAVLLLPYISRDALLYLEIADTIGKGEFVKGMNFCADIPPLYQMVIAIPVYLGFDARIGALAISLFSSILLLVPLFLLVRYVFNEKVALWTLFFATIHPELIHAAAKINRESIFCFFMIFASYFLVKLYVENKLKDCVLFALFCSLAYLTRKEAAELIILLGCLIPISFFIFSYKEACSRLGRYLLIISLFFLFCYPFSYAMRNTNTNWRIIDSYKLQLYLKGKMWNNTEKAKKVLGT